VARWPPPFRFYNTPLLFVVSSPPSPLISVSIRVNAGIGCGCQQPRSSMLKHHKTPPLPIFYIPSLLRCPLASRVSSQCPSVPCLKVPSTVRPRRLVLLPPAEYLASTG